MIIDSSSKLKIYQQAVDITTSIHLELKKAAVVGVTLLELDNLATDLCKKHQVKPAFLGVRSGAKTFQHASCLSLNDVVVHGVPTDQKLKDGDLLKIDFGVIYKGFFTDQCITVEVGQVSAEDKLLVNSTRNAVKSAVLKAVEGNTTGDIGHEIESLVAKDGFCVARQYIGHGIGTSLHDQPEIPAWGQPGGGAKLKSGMTICVEAQVIAGSDQLFTDQDGWTVKTADGSHSAMFEYMVVVGKNKPTILSQTYWWKV